MSHRHAPKSARDHPEIIAIALEITLDPTRRQHYSPLILTLADAAMQHLREKVLATPPGDAQGEEDPDP